MIDRVLLLIGPPAIGKTVLAHGLFLANPKTVIHLDPDTIITALAQEGADLGTFIKHNTGLIHQSPLVAQELHCFIKHQSKDTTLPAKSIIVSGFPRNQVELSSLSYVFGPNLPVSIVELTGVDTSTIARITGLSRSRTEELVEGFSDLRSQITSIPVTRFDLKGRDDPITDLATSHLGEEGLKTFFAPIPSHGTPSFPPPLPPTPLDIFVTPADPISSAIICQSTLRLSDSRRRWKQFCGTHPISLNYESMSKVQQQRYAVSPKVDGTRLFAVIHGSRFWFINRRMQVWMGPPQERLNQFHDTLLDTEVSMTPGGPLVTIIDVICVRARCIRSDPLFSRLDAFNHSGLASSIARYPVRFVLQSYLPLTAIPSLVHKIETGITDGIVFTPTSRSYRLGQSDTLFKWKPNAQNTVDLALYHHEDGSHHGYCTSSDQQKYSDCGPILGTLADTLPTGTIIECVPHPTTPSAWTIVRTRHDKSRPNFSSVVDNIISTIRDNITPDDLVATLIR